MLALSVLPCGTLVRAPVVRHPAGAAGAAVHARMESRAAQAAHHGAGRQGQLRATAKVEKGKQQQDTADEPEITFL